VRPSLGWCLAIAGAVLLAATPFLWWWELDHSSGGLETLTPGPPVTGAALVGVVLLVGGTIAGFSGGVRPNAAEAPRAAEDSSSGRPPR
jgi:hypothetical protein